MNASAGTRREGNNWEYGSSDDWVGGEMAFVRRCVGRGGGIAHLEGVAIVFVDEEIRTSQGDIVVEFCAVLVDMVPI